MAENNSLDTDQKITFQPANRMTSDTQQNVADPEPSQPTENDSHGLTIQAHEFPSLTYGRS